MTDLWKQILDNLAFVGVSLAIVVGLALLARLAEHFLPEKRKVSPARRVSIIGISAAIAAAVPAVASASKTRGEYGYFLLDTDAQVDTAAIAALPGVLRVRVLHQ